MPNEDSNPVKRVAVVGCGLIGGSWAALFLARGLTVTAHDPAPGAQEHLTARIAKAWPGLVDLDLAASAVPPSVTFCGSLAEAVSGADFIQENTPEDEAGKIAAITAIDALAAPGTVIASSSSGFLVSRLQSRAHHPERIVLGHPYTPPHLMPLVEVAGGEQTGEAAIESAMAFYRSLGHKPIRMKREIYRHIANRLQAVIWNEAVALVEEGVVDVAELDAAVTQGPGLRWAIIGPFLARHLSGGEGGFRHALTMLGEPAGSEGDRGRRVTLSPELAGRMEKEIEAMTQGRGIAALEDERDRLLVALRKTLQDNRL